MLNNSLACTTGISNMVCVRVCVCVSVCVCVCVCVCVRSICNVAKARCLLYIKYTGTQEFLLSFSVIYLSSHLSLIYLSFSLILSFSNFLTLSFSFRYVLPPPFPLSVSLSFSLSLSPPLSLQHPQTGVLLAPSTLFKRVPTSRSEEHTSELQSHLN